MGCAQSKPPTSHSPPSGGVDRLKLDGRYLPAAAAGGAKRPQPPRGPAERRERVRVADAAAGGGGGRRERERERVGRDDGAAEKTKAKTKTKTTTMAMATPPSRGGGEAEEMVDGWPRWLLENIPREVLSGLVGQGTYSNVYKAIDRDTGKIVALKKVRFDTSESESVRFMAREIMILQRLDHPNVIKLEGLATSRMHYSLYLVFDFMQTDLARVISCSDQRLTEPQVKCYMQQLLSGLQHCHQRGILHRDIKGSNLLIDKYGMLKIADFGLANYFNPNKKRPLTSRVVTLWYRAPELLLGTTDYGVGIDLWSAGCLLAEMFAGRPIMPGRNEIEQLHRIYKLCGSPPDDYWSKMKLSPIFRSPQSYKPAILETFKDFPSSSLGLLSMLLALDPSNRGTAASALQNEFFSTNPLACDLSGLPVIYKEDKDDYTHLRDGQKRKSSKLKQRSYKQREDAKKIEADMARRKADSGSSKEEEKPTDVRVQIQEIGSSVASTSSSITKPKKYAVVPGESLYPGSYLPQEVTQRSDAHPSASKNIKNFPPHAAIEEVPGGPKGRDVMHRYGLDRSISMSEFHRMDGKDLSKLYVLVD
ncbi:putative serine/threonine-protein kinase [Ananas comosus]|uniref:[RNA-polymerase]-subunit kinase n=1 Tax=Ananas comosus TaxID=4615 RepID=A0A199V2P6_ANACO|nr:putative serine/threonine-protein kinase [Ananas comosus]